MDSAQARELDAKNVEDSKASVKQGTQGQELAEKTAIASKPRIDCVDGARFALVLPIILSHFARFGIKNQVILRAVTQENVFVGGFFAITGYILGYVATKRGERDVDDTRLAKPELFFWQKLMSYYPLHFLVSTAFAPMYVWMERQFLQPWRTIGFRALLNYTLLQAWFPKEEQIWNQSGWVLSALTFSNLAMPTFILPQVSRLSKDGLWKLLGSMTLVSVLQKVAYNVETGRFHNFDLKLPLIWNLTRFHPVWALVEMTMGVAAVRDVLLDTEQDKQRTPRPMAWFAAAYASLLLRLTRLDLNDSIVRGTLFVPLFTKFLRELHRDSLREEPSGITRFFGSRMMVRLGAMAFPMFICHGPIGQVFYKRVIARKLWGGAMPRSFFPVYLAIVLLVSHLLNDYFVKSRVVAQGAGGVARWLAARTEGSLQDDDRTA